MMENFILKIDLHESDWNNTSNKMELFITKISTDRGLPSDEILKQWAEFSAEHASYKKMKKPELLEICKTNGYAIKGSKDDLIAIILNKVPEPQTPEKAPVKAAAKPEPLQTSILSKMTASIQKVVIKRNEHGNYEHSETGLVFNPKTREVIGKQVGVEVVEITKEDIQECNRLNFKYKTPFNLYTPDDDKEGADMVEEELGEDDIDETQLVAGDEDEDTEEEIEYDE